MRPPAIYLFDSLRLLPAGTAGRSPLDLRSTKLQAMLAYLILQRGTPIDRSALGKALWPERDERAARRYVREYLYRARNLLADVFPAEKTLESDETFLLFTAPERCWIDVATFEQLIHRAADLPPEEAVPHLQQAIALYTGPLLANLYDDWVRPGRERYRNLLMDALQQLGEGLQMMGDLAGAIAAGRQMLEQEPLQESIHRRLMELYYLHGDRAKALQQYESCRTLLAEDLGASPMHETVSLYRSILEGRYRRGPLLVPSPDRAAPTGQPVPFVGRQTELAALTALMERVQRGEPEIFLILGESGIGKTRLAREWLACLPQEMIVLQGRAHEFEREIAYRPLLDALQQSLPLIPWDLLPGGSSYGWLAPLAQLLPDLYFYLPDLPATATPDAGSSRHPIMEALAQLLLSLARRTPLVLFLDDLHWADLPTWQTLSFLTHRIGRAPLLLLGTFSTSEASHARYRYLRRLEQEDAARSLILSPMASPDLVELAGHMLGDSLERTASLADRLYRLGRGNPFITVETLRALLARDAVVSPAAIEAIPLPTTVRAFIQNRLDRLDPDSRQCLAMAAALDMAFDLSLLAEINGEEERLIGYLDDWMARGLVDDEVSGYRFRHPQVREVAYRQLSRPRRRRLHYRIACVLERRQPPVPERVAYHYERSHQP